MSGLYNPNFSHARAASPQIRTTSDVDRSQYLSELLAEHQKLGPFIQVLPICSRLLNQDRLRNRSPSPMSSSNLMSNVTGTGLGGWNPQEGLMWCSCRFLVANVGCHGARGWIHNDFLLHG
ncbi:hypothetical protein K1719_012318 [Acacia pycnantha]|nr:hypothetical protein K1719_012318 [Acacia pycnantha]